MNLIETIIIDIEQFLRLGASAPDVDRVFKSRAIDEPTLEGIIAAHVLDVDVPAKGVRIVRPSVEQQKIIAALLEAGATEHHVPVEFFAAAMCQESRFAVECQNGNYLGANPQKTNDGTDWGMGQINGANLASQPGMQGLTWPDMIAKVMSAEWAVPRFCSMYADLLTWADSIIDHRDTSEVWATERMKIYAAPAGSITVPWTNRYWLAALAYNRGQRGALAEVAANDCAAHPGHVAAFCNDFSDVVGRAHVMPN